MLSKNGTKTLLEAYDETTWKTFATDLAAGDKLTLTYEQPYVYGDASNIFVKLKDFRTEALSKVTFTLGTEGTVITVKNAKGDVVTPDKDGSYTLRTAITPTRHRSLAIRRSKTSPSRWKARTRPSRLLRSSYCLPVRSPSTSNRKARLSP
ncbi:MAG: hypothetical protein ACLR8U_01625 [Oscillospiraceae bacterium]